MKKVNVKKIQKFGPCKDRIDNYIEHYGEQTFTVKEFLALDKITFKDKAWVAFRLMPKKNIRFAAGHIAKTVLHIFENKYPNDHRPRNAIKKALELKLNNTYDAYNAAADAAVYAAVYAVYAAWAARAAAWAAYAAAYDANSAYAVASAAYDAAYASDSAFDIERKQLKILLKYWENK